MSDNRNNGEILIFQSEDGETRIEVRFEGETAWLTQMQMAELFQKDKRTISEHIANVYQENELTQEATVRNFRTAAGDRTLLAAHPAGTSARWGPRDA